MDGKTPTPYHLGAGSLAAVYAQPRLYLNQEPKLWDSSSATFARGSPTRRDTQNFDYHLPLVHPFLQLTWIHK